MICDEDKFTICRLEFILVSVVLKYSFLHVYSKWMSSVERLAGNNQFRNASKKYKYGI